MWCGRVFGVSVGRVWHVVEHGGRVWCGIGVGVGWVEWVRCAGVGMGWVRMWVGVGVGCGLLRAGVGWGGGGLGRVGVWCCGYAVVWSGVGLGVEWGGVGSGVE